MIGTKSETISANGYSSIRIPMNVEDGYTVSFAVGYALNNLNVSVYNFYYDHDNKETVIGVKNTSSSSITINAIARCLAERNMFY